MGSALCTLFKHRPVRVLYFGLDAAGKTTLLYKLKLGEVVTTIPTIGFNVETLKINGVEMMTWDMGVRKKSRSLLRHYMPNTDALLFMIDSSDRERLKEAVDEFFEVIYPTVEERQIPVLVLANKQDQKNVLSPTEIKEAIYKRGGKAFHMNTTMEVFPTVATTSEGVDAAYEWLTSKLALRLAHESYISPLSFSNIAQYPTSFVKSSYLKIAGLFSGSKDQEALSANSSSVSK